MKVRIGLGTNAGGLDLSGYGALLDAMVERRFDSLWLPEVLTGSGIDPLIGLSMAAVLQPSLKLGTTIIFPGRNPVRLAKSLANLDALSGGRLLVTAVPGLADGAERSSVGPQPRRRGELIEEMLPVLRSLWNGETVSHDGAIGSFSNAVISPLPVQRPLEVWLGGILLSSQQRCGRISDGWLPAMLTPQEAGAGRLVVEAAAESAGRHIDPEHFGVSIGYLEGPPPAPVAAAIERRLKGRPFHEVVPTSLRELRILIERYIEVGFSKFVVRPHVTPTSWDKTLDDLAAAVLDLQT